MWCNYLWLGGVIKGIESQKQSQKAEQQPFPNVSKEGNLLDNLTQQKQEQVQKRFVIQLKNDGRINNTGKMRIWY